MREYKFRGKWTFDGKWVYGLLRMREGLDHSIIEQMNGAGYDVDPKTVGQYTGLKDRNGREIYEGDILKQFDGVHRVSWDQKQQGFRDERGYRIISSCIVIGTIYENPDLLIPKP